MDTTINPLDYANQFTFPAKDGHIQVTQMNDPGNWMITGRHFTAAFTVNGDWVPLRGLNPSDPDDVALVAYDRDRAIAVAHRLANP